MPSTLEEKIGLERILLLVKCGNFKSIQVEPGDLIHKEGEPVLYAYWADALEFSANKTHPSSERLYLGQHKVANQFVGEESILTGQPSSFNIIAKSSTRLILVPIDTLLEILIEDTKISIWYIKAISLKSQSILDSAFASSRDSLSHCIAADIINRYMKRLTGINTDCLEIEALCMGCSTPLYSDAIQNLVEADLLEIDPLSNIVMPISIDRLSTFLKKPL